MRYVQQYTSTDHIIYRHLNRATRANCMHVHRMTTLEAFTEAAALVADGKLTPFQMHGYTVAEVARMTEREFSKQICNLPWLPCECGKYLQPERVIGKDSGKVAVCNGKCMGATGQQCDCPCQGENHGGRHAGKLATRA